MSNVMTASTTEAMAVMGSVHLVVYGDHIAVMGKCNRNTKNATMGKTTVAMMNAPRDASWDRVVVMERYRRAKERSAMTETMSPEMAAARFVKKMPIVVTGPKIQARSATMGTTGVAMVAHRLVS